MATGKISITPLPSGRTERSFTVHFAGHNISTTVTRRPSAVRRWIYRTRRLHCYHLHRLVVGLGVQWRPSTDPEPSTLQLCVGRRCLIFHLIHSRSIPNALRRFLENQEITFAAVGVRYDCRLLMEEHDLRVGKGVEIRHLAEERMQRKNAAMADMADEILGFGSGIVRRAKAEKVGMSRWDVSELSHRQIIYASVDAYISFLLGLKLV